MSLSLAEQETTMTWDSDERLVRVFSARPADQRKLGRLGFKPHKGSEEQGFFYILPLDKFRWGVRRAGGGKGRPFKPAVK